MFLALDLAARLLSGILCYDQDTANNITCMVICNHMYDLYRLRKRTISHTEKHEMLLFKS
jgi:hypothetical protein